MPSDKDRLVKARLFEAGMKAHDFDYKYFTNYENAIDWLSEIKTQ